MTTTAGAWSASAGMMPSMNTPAPQAAQHHSPDGTKKRPHAKNVTWASPDKLNQVRLFAAEDAPSLSSVVLQDLLEAKKTKFMHALAPVSADDLPPGFEGTATKRARLDSAAILAMNPQTAWHSPDRVRYDPSWQVALGNESSEVKAQLQREVRVLEAIYPRPSAIPPSSMELSEAPPDLKDLQIPEIPLIPTEDEDDAPDEEDLSGGIGTSQSAASNPISGSETSSIYPPGYSPPKDTQNVTFKTQSKGGSSATAQFNSDLTTAFLKNADPDVAAAAAAAYAVLKAKESGALIDHELLIKILSNPLLIETLSASHPNFKNQLENTIPNSTLSRGNANGNGIKMRTEPFSEGSLLSSSSSFMAPGWQRYDLSDGMQVMPGWGSHASGLPTFLGRGYPMVSAHEQSSASKAMLGQARGAYAGGGPPGRSYPIPRPDISRELIQQHGVPGMIANEAHLRQSATPMAFDEGMMGHDSEWYRSSMVQPWLGINSNALSSAALTRSNQVVPQERLGGPKIRKHCFFFNTPRGCRNGIHCNFLHEVATEKPPSDKMQHDAGQETPQPDRGDTSDSEAK